MILTLFCGKLTNTLFFSINNMISYSKINEVKEILEIDRRVANINADKIPIKYIVAHMLY